MRRTVPVAAAFIAAALTSVSVHAAENSWPCAVLLCISNPCGVFQFAQCARSVPVPNLALEKPFPVCREGDFTSVRNNEPTRRNSDGIGTVHCTDGSDARYLINPAHAYLGTQPQTVIDLRRVSEVNR